MVGGRSDVGLGFDCVVSRIVVVIRFGRRNGGLGLVFFENSLASFFPYVLRCGVADDRPKGEGTWRVWLGEGCTTNG